MGLTCVCSSTGGIPVVILGDEGGREITKPAIVRRRLADPPRTRMILMRGLIAMDTGLCRGRGIHVRRRMVVVKNILCGPKKLRGFKYHLDNVFVAMPLCGNRGDCMKKEDIHLARGQPGV